MLSTRRTGPITAAAAALAVVSAGCADSTPDSFVTVGPAATIVAAGGSHPTVAVDPATGRGFVAWVGSDMDLYNVYLAAADEGSNQFRAPRRVNDIAGDAAPHEQAPAQVAVGANGAVYVLWQNNTVIEGRRFPASDLRLAVSTDQGETFAPAITVNDDAGDVPSSHTFHDITVGADGTVFVSWIDSREQDRATTQHAGHSDAEMMMAGPEIRVASSIDNGRSFGASAVIDTNSCPCCRTSIVTGPDGTVYVAWRKHFPGEIRDIVVASAAPGTLEFGEPVRVHADDWEFPGCPHAGPSLATDGDGRLHVGWYTGKEDRQGLWYTVSEDGGRSFGAPTALVTGEWVPPSQVSLTQVGSSIIATWEDRTGEAGTVVLGESRSDRGSASVAASVPGRGPALDGGENAALLVWLDGESIHGQRATPAS